MLNETRLNNYLPPLWPIPTQIRPKGSVRTKLECILFDIYGTLFISGSGDIGTAKKNTKNLGKLETLLADYGLDEQPQRILDKLFLVIEKEHQKLKKSGIDYPEVDIIRIWKRVLDIESVQAVSDFALEFEVIANPVYPMPHLAELLSACRDRGIHMGIISNAQFYTPLLFKWFLNSNLPDLGFDPNLVFLSYQHGYAKPSPVLFQRAVDQLDEMGIETGSVLYLGNDMLNDILPATRTGFQTALFAGDARSLRLRKDDPRCRSLAADLVITDLIHLVKFLDQ
jgi:putative hydrolase of the HAD superfamily